MKNILLLIGLLYFSVLVHAQKVAEPSSKSHPEWTNPYPPFQIVGNLYYVGTEDLACYLITTPAGNILINTGTASSAPLLKSNIEKLGFKLADTKILLTTQAHYDHMGAMAAIKKMSGAKLMVDAGDASVVADGGTSDYYFGGKAPVFEPVKVDRQLHNNDVVSLGNMRLTLRHHPGHTKGSCSFLFDVKDKSRTYRVLIANLPTILVDKFTQASTYPNMAKDYAYTLNAMKGLKFDIWLSSHASQFNLQGKHKPGSPYNPSAFIDRKGYDEQLAQIQKEYDKKVLLK